MFDDFQLNTFKSDVITETGRGDAVIRTEAGDGMLTVYLSAKDSHLCSAELAWDLVPGKGCLVLGDVWERSYGDLCFLPWEQNDRAMPWYFMATNGKRSFCLGVKTQPNAFVCFRTSKSGVTAVIDCRNGGAGVELNGRELEACTFITRIYDNSDPFAALCAFCRELCPAPILPHAPVYGGNDWYNAYGHNSFDSVTSAARIHSECASGIGNVPFMVVDDGWEQGDTAGPWLPNGKFKDMKKTADRIRSFGLRPGIWIRPLLTEAELPEEILLTRGGEHKFMDPTHPETQRIIREDIARIRGWGYELLKYDYSTNDLFGLWGMEMGDKVTPDADWHFYDRTKTNAEILLDFYRLIRDAAGDLLLIGCNTVSHLCAGLVEINRTGDDTSGREWGRTRDMGVNTLAFRLAQNGAFYIVDADCVGMPANVIPWEKNRQWMRLLAYSNTALFLSLDEVTEEQKAEIAVAYRTAQQPHTIRPLDWTENKTPCVWEIDGETVRFDWDL